MNDRGLRKIITGLGGATNGSPRETGFDITAASEVMAILALARDLARSAPPAGRDHGGLQPHRRARHRRADRLRRLDGRPAQGRDHAESRADARGSARVRALRAVRQHRARQLVADRRPHRAQDGRLRDHRVGLRRGHGHAEVHGHRLPPGRHPPGRGRHRRDRQGTARARRIARRQGVLARGVAAASCARASPTSPRTSAR